MEQLSIAASIHSTPSTNYLPVLVLEKTVSENSGKCQVIPQMFFFFKARQTKEEDLTGRRVKAIEKER